METKLFTHDSERLTNIASSGLACMTQFRYGFFTP
jgi:hypothetical protein